MYTIVTLSLAALWLGLPPPAMAAVNTQEHTNQATPVFEQKSIDADEARDSGDHHTAALLYTEAYDALPPAERSSSFGSSFVDAAVSSHVRAFEATNDLTELKAAKELLKRFVATMNGSAPELRDLSNEAMNRIAEIDEMLGDHLLLPVPTLPEQTPPEQVPEQLPPEQTPPEQVPEQLPPEPIQESTPPKIEPLTLGLTIGGGTLLAVGIGEIAYGSWFASRTTSISAAWPAMSPNVDNSAEFAAWRKRELRNARAHIGIGGVLAVAGAAALTVGVVWLIKRRSSTKSGGIQATTRMRRMALRVEW